MATKIGSLFGDVSLRTAQLDKDVAKVGRKLRKLGNSMTSLGKSLSLKVTAPLVGIGIAATKTFADFEKGMNEVRSLMPDLNQGEFVELREDVRALAVELGVNAVEATKALYQAISAGVPKENAIEFLRISSKAAIAGLTTTETSVDTLTSVLNAYKRSAEDAEAVADVLFTTVRLGKTNFEELGASIFNVAPLAAAMNIPLEEVSAAVATLTKQGVPTAQAMTQIRGALVALQKPNKQMVAALNNLGYETAQALLDAQGLQGALQTLRTESGLTSSELTKAFGRVEAFGAVLGLTAQNFSGAVEDLRAMTEASGAMVQAFETNNEGIARSFERTLSILRELGFQIAEQLAPWVEKVAATFKAWYMQNQESIPGWAALAVKIGAVAALLGPLAVSVGTLVALLGGPGGLVAVVIALSGAFGALLVHFNVFQEVGEALGTLLVDIFTNPVAAIASFIGLIAEIVELFTGPFGLSFSFQRVRQDVINMFDNMIAKVQSFIRTIRDAISWLGSLASKAAGSVVGGASDLLGFRAEGGPVSAGSPYIVGEQGPELFVPRYSGTIVPNHALAGGGGGQTIHMHFAPGIGMDVVTALKNSKSLIARMAVDAVREDNLRRV